MSNIIYKTYEEQMEEEFDLHNRDYGESCKRYPTSFDGQQVFIYYGRCIHCNHIGLVKWGNRYLKNGIKNQKWMCVKCKKTFTEREEKRMRILPYIRKDIKYSDFKDLSLRKIANIINKKYNTHISHITVMRIIKEEQPSGDKK